MRRSNLSTIIGVGLVVLFATMECRAQSNASAGASGAKQDQLTEELLGEVRQLRIALQQISVNAYRGQVLVERLRLQQEQVNRLSQELNSTRNQIGEIRSNQVSAKAKFDAGEKELDKGLVSESLIARYREVLEELKRHEQRLAEREVQIFAQLETERSNLVDLNKRLDTLELEMLTSQSNDKPKR